VVPFGLISVPSTFSRLMECLLQTLTYKICLIYLDDILIYSRAFEEHLSNFRQVLDRLRHANLKLNSSKSNFACQKVTYHVISSVRISPDEDKISARKL